MKKISLSIIIFVSYLAITPSVLARTPLREKVINTIRETVEEGKKEGSNPAFIRQEVRENIKEDKKENKISLLDKVKDFMKKNLRFEARVRGAVTIVSSNNFSLTGEDGTFQVNVTDQTKLLRKFGGKSALSEYSVGDEVVVFGKFTDSTKLIIDAKTIRNNSIQKRFGAFFGKVTVKNSDNFVMETLERGTQTVYFGTAKIVDRKETSISYGDIKVGDRIRVKGVWDKTLNKINEVIQIKDFSIPVVVPTQAAQN
ncbi:MAG: hypothetical protein WC744_03640 [Patescibacteria group bacterium]|jgi:hypothetical protein